MSGKYTNLSRFLSSRREPQWIASFADIEEVLGSPLPESARSYQAWWSNQMKSQSLSWQSVGWKTKDLNLSTETVTFIHVGEHDVDGHSRSFSGETSLSIAEAKTGLASTFGVDPSQIEITIKG